MQLMMRMKPEQWHEVLEVNLSGVFFATQVGSLNKIGPVSWWGWVGEGTRVTAAVVFSHD